jgi:glutaredoxin
MNFENPSKSGFTIYSKFGCPNCMKIKALLKEKHLLFNIVDCDEYLIEHKSDFLFFISQLANKEVTTFPLIFYDNKFVGNYNETLIFVDKLLLSFDDNFSF